MAARTGGGVRGLWTAAACLVALAGAGARADVAVSPGLRLSLEERYDDDLLLRTGEGTGGQLMTKVTPRGSLGVRGRTFSLSGAYAPSLFLRHGSGTTTLDHQLELDADKQLSRLLRLGGSVDVWRVSDPTSLPRAGMASTARPVLYGRADTWARLALSRRLLLRGSYRFEGLRILEGGRPPGLLHQPGMDLTYRLTPRATLGTEYRFQSFLFGPEAAHAHHVGALWGYRLTRSLNLQVRGGPVWYQGTGGAGLMPRVVVDLSQVRSRFDWGVALGHDLVGASGLYTALWADFASLAVGWSLRSDLRVSAAANYFRNGRAPDVGVLPGTDDGRVSQGYGLGAGLQWQLHPSFALHGTVNRIAQVGEAAAAVDLTRNIVSLRAVLTAWE